jgi:hypothetical protein
MNQLVPWNVSTAAVVSDSISDPGAIAEKALQLRPRERNQIAMNLAAGNFEVASIFVWTRTMALLKKQLGTLGSSFIGELLQRPDIDENTDLSTAVSETEAISLARDLGIFTPLQMKRLLHSQAIVTHFAGGDSDPNDDPDEEMTLEEAISCLRVCVQGVLGHENIGAAEDFKSFRQKLETETLTGVSPEIIRLSSAPYFFVRTAISILLSIFKTAKGAQIEHASRNALLVIGSFWSQLKDPERWQIGQAYAVEFSEGRKNSVKALHAVLLQVSGFDYVPENLRSATFVRVASSVIAAHQGMNNFYNEPAPMRELASLGTSIPSPALATCMTAALCVKMGNSYGVSNAAQPYADKVLGGLSKDRWIYYLNGRLAQDWAILGKLSNELPRNKWISIISATGIDPSELTDPAVKSLIVATNRGELVKIREISARMYASSIGNA